jgi:hypothetical protein
MYDLNNLLAIIQSELGGSKDDPLLLECLGELHLAHKQPAKALPYFLRLRRPQVFDLIREYNLFSVVQDQALLLVEFDRERTKSTEGVQVQSSAGKHGAAIQLLVDHTHSIPVGLPIHRDVLESDSLPFSPPLTVTDRQGRGAARPEAPIPLHVPRLVIR